MRPLPPRPSNDSSLRHAMPRAVVWSLWMLAVVWIGCGCAMTRPIIVDQVAGMVAAGMDSYEQEEDLALLQSAFPAHIKLLETIGRSDPRHPGINLLLSRLYAGYGFAFLDPEIEALRWKAGTAPEDPADLRTRADRFYRRGAEYALASLAGRHPDFQAQLARIDRRNEALARLTAADGPALFWYAFNLGSRVDLNRKDLRLVARAHLAEKAMQRVIELLPGYYHGAAHLFLMVYYARHPAAGAQPDPLVEGHYRAVCALANGARLAADVFYAAEVLSRGANRQAFTTLLDQVIASSNDGARCLMDRVALARAPGLRAAAGRIFNEEKVP